MATLEELVVKLSADTEELKAQLTTATKITDKAAKDMQKAITEFSDKSSQKTSFFQSAMATMTGFLSGSVVQGAFNAVKDAAGLMAGELLKGIEAAEKQEQAMARLANALNASGKYSQKAASDLDDFASSMEVLTGIGDDVVLSNLSVLSSMTRLNTEGLQKAQKSAIELSAAMGIDLDGATRLVGKAIEGNGAALKRYGIDIQTTSDKTQNLALVTKALNDKFGGAAAAQMNTFGGALKGLKNAWDNVTEAVSTSITGNQVFITAMKAVTGIFQDFEKYAKENATALRDDLGKAFIDLLGFVQNTLDGLSTFFQYTYAGFSALATGVSTVVNGFMALGWAVEGNTEKAGQYLDKIVESANGTNQAFSDIGKHTFLNTISDKLGEVKDKSQEAFDKMAGSAASTAPALQKVTGTVVELTEAQTAHNEVIKAFGEGLASQAQALDNNYQYMSEITQGALELQLIAAEDNFNAQVELQTAFFQTKAEMAQAQFELEQQALDEARANNLLTEAQHAAAVVALNQKRGVEMQKASIEQTKYEQATQKTREANFKSSMDTIATLSTSGNKELAAIGKAAAITNATIDGYAAVQKALASAPPPFNFALAAVVGVAAAANVAKIAGVGFNKGTDSVPGIGSRDSVPALLTPGERVVPQKTNEDLTNFLQNQGQGSNQTVNLNITMNIAPGTGIDRDQAATIVEGINNYIAAGGLKVIGA